MEDYRVPFLQRQGLFCRQDEEGFLQRTPLQKKGIALFDTASAIRRLQDNASDKFLEVVQPTDIPALLHRIPQCKAIVTTGEKATDTLCTQFSIDKPKVGDFTEFLFENHPMRLYRMPSSSRAYPLALEKKAAAYRIIRFINAYRISISLCVCKLSLHLGCFITQSTVSAVLLQEQG